MSLLYVGGFDYLLCMLLFYCESRYILMSEPDHIIVKPIPNLSKDGLGAAFPFFYIQPKKFESVLRKYFPEEMGPITNNDPIGNSPVIVGKDSLKKITPTWMNVSLAMKKDPETDKAFGWVLEIGFQGIYDVEHFIRTLRYDVQIVESILDIRKNGKTKKLKAFQIFPLRDAHISWYTTDALNKMKEHGAIYLTPFSHRLAEEIDNPEYQRLRCRVNYHALRFKPHIMKLSESIVDKLRAQGHFMSIHLWFEMNMLAFARCFDIFTPEQQRIFRFILFGSSRSSTTDITVWWEPVCASCVEEAEKKKKPARNQVILTSTRRNPVS